MCAKAKKEIQLRGIYNENVPIEQITITTERQNRFPLHWANDTRKCVIFIYFDFMRIFSFMWLPIFESVHAIECIVSLRALVSLVHFVVCLFFSRESVPIGVAVAVLLSHSLFFYNMPNKVRLSQSFSWWMLLLSLQTYLECCIPRMQLVNSFALAAEHDL